MVFEGAFQNIVGYTAGGGPTGVPAFLWADVMAVYWPPSRMELNGDCTEGTPRIDPDTPGTTRQWVERVALELDPDNFIYGSPGCDTPLRESFSQQPTQSSLPSADVVVTFPPESRPGTRPYGYTEPRGVVPKHPQEPEKFDTTYGCDTLDVPATRSKGLLLGHTWRPGNQGEACYSYTFGSSRAWYLGPEEILEETKTVVNTAMIRDIVFTGNDTGESFTYKPIYFAGDVRNTRFGPRVVCFYVREDLV